MTSKTFVTGTTIDSAWLNDVNSATYNGGAVYTPAGTGSVPTTVQDKLRESVSVLDFGAVGDGVTDDTVAIQAAIDYCLANGRALFIPTGKYRLTAQVNIDLYSAVFERGLVMHGEGWGSRFLIDHTGTGFSVTCSPSFGIYQAEFHNLYFTDGTASPAKIIHNNGAINTLLQSCIFHNSTVTTGCVVNDNAYGLRLKDCGFHSIVGTGVLYAQVANLSTYSYVNAIESCDFSTCSVGITLQGCNVLQVSNTVIQECDIGVYAEPVGTLTTAFNMSFDCCWFERNVTADLQLNSDATYWCEANLKNCQFSGIDPIYQCHIDLYAKSKITLDGCIAAGNTVIVTGNSGASVTSIRSTGFTQSGSFAWTELQAGGRLITPYTQVDASFNQLVGTTVTLGEVANTKASVAGLFRTEAGTNPNPASGATVTLVAIPNLGSSTWLVSAVVIAGNDPAATSCVGILTVQQTTAVYTSLKTATGLTVSVSALNLQGNQTTGGPNSIGWSVTRLF